MNESRSYYGRPVLKDPAWKPEVPFYLFSGGLAGASAGLAFGATLAGNRPLARRAWVSSLAGMAASPPLLVADLGRPERFVNMLRVIKVTSPMSVGSWLLVAAGGSIAAGAAHELAGVPPRAIGRAAQVAAALLGLPLVTYTAVLLSTTAVPVWHEARRELPFVFAGSAMASAGGAGVLLTPVAHAGPARRLTLGGLLLEAAATQVMERRLGVLAEPYRQGTAGALARGAKALNAVGAAAVGLGGGRSRLAAAAGGVATLGGSLVLRWAVFRAGFQSVRGRAN